jgi:hypothetical protein
MNLLKMEELNSFHHRRGLQEGWLRLPYQGLVLQLVPAELKDILNALDAAKADECYNDSAQL